MVWTLKLNSNGDHSKEITQRVSLSTSTPTYLFHEIIVEI
jgi:hypothetical protein